MKISTTEKMEICLHGFLLHFAPVPPPPWPPASEMTCLLEKRTLGDLVVDLALKPSLGQEEVTGAWAQGQNWKAVAAPELAEHPSGI